MQDADLALAFDRAILGFASADARQIVRSRHGALMDWLSPPGEPLAACPVFFAMEAEFERLRKGEIDRFDLPGLRLPGDAAPFSVSALYDRDRKTFLIFANADHGAQDVERLLARERRETRVLEDQAQAAGRVIREQAALYRDIVESSSDLVFRLGADLRVTFVNAQACKLFGQSEGQMVGRSIDQTLPAASAEDRWGARVAAHADASFEQSLAMPDGGALYILWSVHWIADRAPGEYQAVGRDISDLRRLRAEALRGAEESRRNAVMRERLRIAQDLHDTLVHSLVALAPQLRLIRKVAGRSASPALTAEFDHADAAIRDGLARARAALTDLRQQTVEPHGLAAALEQLCRRFTERTGVHALADIDSRAQAAERECAETLFRIAEEALRNAELHAHARRVSVSLEAGHDGALTLVIADDGRGFDPKAPRDGHFGLIGMRERAEQIGAELTIDSRPKGGARVTVVAPARAD